MHARCTCTDFSHFWCRKQLNILIFKSAGVKKLRQSDVKEFSRQKFFSLSMQHVIVQQVDTVHLFFYRNSHSSSWATDLPQSTYSRFMSDQHFFFNVQKKKIATNLILIQVLSDRCSAESCVVVVRRDMWMYDTSYLKMQCLNVSLIC